MINVRYKSGWLRFKTIEELSEITGWSFDRITFALRTNTAIMGVKLVYGEAARSKKKPPIQLPPNRPAERKPSYQEMKNQLRMINKRKSKADRVIKRYEDSWFPGRIETNEIKHARNESVRLQLELEKVRRAIAHYKKYEQRNRNVRYGG